jgi:hypothetical protein
MSTMPKVWDDEVVQRYLTPESHQKSRQEFLDTHIDIDKIHAEYLYPHEGTDEFVTQDELRDAIVKSNIEDDNRIFILKGETGSGKSQLCQWLEYQIGTANEAGLANDDEHIALHVSRSKTRISDILQILTEPLGEGFQTSTSNVEDLDPERVADAIITTLDAFAPSSESLQEEELRKLVEKRPNSRDLREILIENIQEYQDAVTSDEEEDIPDLLDADDYKNLALQAFNSARGGDTIFPSLRDKIHEILSQNLGVNDFKAQLEELSEEYADRGLRPVLICEDLTTFSVLKEQLLDHIFQLDSGHYDVVLGWTTGWEQDQLDRALSASEDTYTYMKDRAEGYLSTTDDQGRAYFLNEDVTVELARKYMQVIREKSETNSGADIPHDDFEGLYPFNSSFVKRAYDNLVQDGVERRTPRLLLIRVIKECLNSSAPPHEAIDGNPYVKQFPSNIKLGYPETHKELAKWYGSTTIDGQIGVPIGIPESFEIEIPDDYIRDDEVVYEPQTPTTVSLSLSHYQGTIAPGESVTLQASLNNAPEPGVQISVDGDIVGETGGDGRLDITLPNVDREVEILAEKENLSDRLTFDVGHDTLSLTTNRAAAGPNEEVTLNVRLNGNPVEGVQIYADDESVATSNDNGIAAVTIPEDGDSIEYSAEYQELSDTSVVSIQDTSGQDWPVETSLSDDEVNQRRYEYEQWLTEGVDYDSDSTLIDGIVAVLNRWHDPTRLSNHNSIATGVSGIYYDRGSEIPIGLQGAKDPQGLSLDLPFGAEFNEIYEPMFWCGISENDQLPDDERYDLDYGALKSWADDRVAEYRQSMRGDIEQCLPDGMTVEELIVFSQYLLHNASKGETDVSAEMTLEEYHSPEAYESPISERFDRGGFRDAYNELTKNSEVPHNLAEGFFQLKEGFIDHDRLEEAVDSVDNNLDVYIQKAMQIDTSELPSAYRVKDSRSGSSDAEFSVFLERIRQYAVELNGLTATADADHIQEAVETVKEWFEPTLDEETVVNVYSQLYDYVDRTDAATKEQMVNWEKRKNHLEQGNVSLRLSALRRDLDYYSDLGDLDAPELMGALHEYEESRNKSSTWDVFEELSDMIDCLEDLSIEGEEDGFTDRIKESSEYSTYETLRSDVENTDGEL